MTTLEKMQDATDRLLKAIHEAKMKCAPRKWGRTVEKIDKPELVVSVAPDTPRLIREAARR